MKTKVLMMLIVGVLLSVANIASAIVVQDIDIDFVTIGNAGNPGDTRAEANPYGSGAVGYNYSIGKYEVTNAQWDTFVTAAGAPTGNPSDAYDESAYWTGTDVPTNKVSWYEALQFCNYLTSGDKYSGAYNFDQSGNFLGIDRDSAVSAYGIAYVIPTEDEWYKAAYYTGSGYSTYANGTDVAPIAGVDTNYNWTINQPWNIDSGTIEQNGTFDMMGNVSEWNETPQSQYRGFRGGLFAAPVNYLRSSSRTFIISGNPNVESDYIGFRVASVPEPCSLVLLSLGGLALMRKCRAK